jgi:hypothetical protein
MRVYEGAARTVMGRSDAQRVVVIAVAPVPLPEPYVFLGLYDRNDAE